MAPAPAALNDRRVEITGPTDRKMTINALNSGAKVWLADFEDASAPTWENVVSGQLNLIDAYDRGGIDFTDPRAGKSYALQPDDELATVVMRPRGWHLDERHLDASDGDAGPRRASSTSACTSSTTPSGCSTSARARTSTCPKTESHLEARLWNDVFVFAQDYARHPAGHHPRDRADRDDHRRVRDGGDPLRAARPRLGAERRPLGLPLLHRQELPRRRRRGSSCRTATR